MPTAEKVETAMKKYNGWLKTAGLDTKEHQLTAMRWALNHEFSSSDGINGGLIADEMGLGKTIILLGFDNKQLSTNDTNCGSAIPIGPMEAHYPAFL